METSMLLAAGPESHEKETEKENRLDVMGSRHKVEHVARLLPPKEIGTWIIHLERWAARHRAETS